MRLLEFFRGEGAEQKPPKFEMGDDVVIPETGEKGHIVQIYEDPRAVDGRIFTVQLDSDKSLKDYPQNYIDKAA